MYIATFTAVVPSFNELLEPYYAVECEGLNISKDISAFKISETISPNGRASHYSFYSLKEYFNT
jgi:hypothetical protein